MIHTFRLQNFKCFQDERLVMRPLTLFVGANGAGKSSLLQALLLVQQVMQTSSDYVRLNGPYQLRLGKTEDVLCQSSNALREILFELTTTDGTIHGFRFNAPDGELILRIAAKPELGGQASRARASLEPFDLAYLGAERLGPRDTLDADSAPSDALKVGVQGEYTAQVLAARERDKVREALRHPRTLEEGNIIQLSKQVELWMQDIAPGIEIQTVPLLGTNMHALRIRRRDVGTEWLRPTNIGFGVSYALPVLVAGLLARPGSLFLVENPEAHLHPAGQSRIGRFLATLAAAGVQVIVETHSDHVLNGVRLAAVDAHPLRYDQVIIHHFHGDMTKKHRAQPIELTAKGGLCDWPAGFFDQSEKDLAAIVEARRRV